MLTKNELKSKIEDCLNKKITLQELSKWAVTQMSADYDSEYEDLIDDIVYSLELSDNPGFELSEDRLKEFIKKLS